MEVGGDFARGVGKEGVLEQQMSRAGDEVLKRGEDVYDAGREGCCLFQGSCEQ